MTTITIDLPDDVIDLLTTKANRAKATVSEFIEGATVRALHEVEDGVWDASLSREDIDDILLGLSQADQGHLITLEKVIGTPVSNA